MSFFDFGFLGQIGAVPGWPGAEAYPVQPMVSQLRAVTVIDEAYLLGILNPDAASQLLRWLNDPAVQQAAMAGERIGSLSFVTS